MAIVVVHGDNTPLVRGFGHRDIDQRLPVTEDTIMPIASATKAFTATLIGTLVDEGLVEWDAPAREYMPELRLWDTAATEQTSLRDMLAHRTGLPRHDLVWYHDQSIPRAELVRRLRYLQPSDSLRQTWQYNNLMYAAAGQIVEMVLGCSWEEAIHERLLGPLGMCDSGATPLTTTDGNVARGYKRSGQVLRPRPFRDNTNCGPAGSIHSTVHDLAAWLRFNLGMGRGPGGEQIISTATLRDLFKPAIVLPPSAVTYPGVNPLGYALGWGVGDYRGHRLLQHSGNTDGFRANVSILPDEQIGVAVLTNLDSTPLRDTATYLILDELLGLASALPEPRTAKDDEETSIARSAPCGDGAAPSRVLTEYVGEYTHPAYGELSVTIADDGLAVQLGDLTLDVRHLRCDAFELYLAAFDQTIPARWEAGFDGVIDTAVLQLEPNADPIIFTRVIETPSAEVLSSLTGRYRNGSTEALVTWHANDSLSITITGRPSVVLEPRAELSFWLQGTDRTEVSFVVESDGRAAELLIRPLGRLTVVESEDRA